MEASIHQKVIVGKQAGRQHPRDPYVAFIKSSLLMVLTGGCTFGAILLIYMGLHMSLESVTRSLVQAHGHLQLYGWVGLFIMGIALHVVPRFKNVEFHGTRRSDLILGLMVFGIVARFFGQPFAASSMVFAGLLVLSGAAEILAVLLFARIMREIYRKAQETRKAAGQTPEIFDRFLWAGLIWLAVATVAGWTINLYMVTRGLDLIPAAFNPAYLHIQIVGFIAMIIMGVAARTLPVFLGLHPPRERMLAIAFWLLNGALLVRALLEPFKALSGWVGGVGWGNWAGWLTSLAAVGELVAVALYLYGLNLFAKREVDLSDLDMDFSYEKFIYFSFIWLFIAELAWSGFAVYEALSGTTVPHALVGSYRHAITVGFISMMIFGYASRIFPVFTGEELRFPKATNATFWLVAAGNTMRVLFQPIAVFTGKGVFFALMASSSVLEVAGLALFSVNIWLTVQKAQHAMLETPAAS